MDMDGTIILREIAGGDATKLVDAVITVTLRESDFQVIDVENTETGHRQPAPATAKILFQTPRWRELVFNNVPCGVFEFYVASPGQEGSASKAYVSGADILWVKVASRIV